jgi:hypothetical protein
VDYYSTAAQVIPVLFILIVLEARLLEAIVFERRWVTAVFAIGAVLLVLVFVAGEWAAFRVLGAGQVRDPAGWESALVHVALRLGITYMGMMGVLIVLKPLRDRGRA